MTQSFVAVAGEANNVQAVQHLHCRIYVESRAPPTALRRSRRFASAFIA
jgi:hypothetical protein